MPIEIIISKEMEGKGFPGIALLDKKTNEVVSYDPKLSDAIREAEDVGYSYSDLIAFTVLDPNNKYIF